MARPLARVQPATGDDWRSLEDAAVAMRRLTFRLDHADVLRRGASDGARHVASAHPLVKAAHEDLRESARAEFGPRFGPHLMGHGPHAELCRAIGNVACRAMHAHLDAPPDATWYNPHSALGAQPASVERPPF